MLQRPSGRTSACFNQKPVLAVAISRKIKNILCHFAKKNPQGKNGSIERFYAYFQNKLQDHYM